MQVEALSYAYAGELVAVGLSSWCRVCGELLPQIVFDRDGFTGLHPQSVIHGASCMDVYNVMYCNVMMG